MQPIGYLYKRIAPASECELDPPVRDIYSLSGCRSGQFADYISFWRHNGFWLFDSPAIMEALAAEQGISLEGMTLFYYEAHELEFDDDDCTWKPYSPVASMTTRIERPVNATLEGFDVTTFAARTSPECSPLSCNSLANELGANSHCLFPSFESAFEALETGRFANSERGPFRIIGVYSVGAI